MAKTHLAKQHGPEGFWRFVVIKQLTRNLFRENLVEEAKTLARLNHPNLVQVIDFAEEAGELRLVLEWVEGLNLAQLNSSFAEKSLPKSFDPVAIWVFCFIAHQVLMALEYCHAQHPSVIHADVTPQNILISRSGNVKLADFGIANATKAMGNPRYAAPHVRMGKSPDVASDLYQMGQVFLEMLNPLPDTVWVRDLKTLAQSACGEGRLSPPFNSAFDMRQALVEWIDDKVKNSLWISEAERELGAAVSKITLSEIHTSPNNGITLTETESLTESGEAIRRNARLPKANYFRIFGLLGILGVIVLIKVSLHQKVDTPKPIPIAMQSPSPLVNEGSPRIVRQAKAVAHLEVQAKPWGIVFINTVKKGITPQRIALPSGSYTLEVVNPERKTRRVQQVTLAPGQTNKILVDLTSP